MSLVRDENPVSGLSEYELLHLGEHLADGGEAAELDRLLALEWRLPPAPDEQAAPSSRRRWSWRRRRSREPPPVVVERGRNSWYDAKEAINDARGYRTDVDAAWKLAAAACADAAARGQHVPAAREVRCALLAASVTSLGGNLPGELLRVMVERRVWTEGHALAYAQEGDLASRQRSLAALLPALSSETRAEVVSDLLAERPAEDGRRDVLQALAPYLDAVQARAAFTEALGNRDKADRSRVASAIALQLADMGHLDEAFDIATRQMPHENFAAETLAGLAPRLDERQIRAGLAVARTWTPPGSLPIASVGLLPRLAALGHAREALDHASELELPFHRGQLAVKLAPWLDRGMREQALELVPPLEGPGGGVRAQALLALAEVARRQGDDAAAERLARDARVALEAIRDERSRAQAIASAAAELFATSQSLPIELVRGIRSANERLPALAALAPHLDDASTARALALEAVRDDDALSVESIAALRSIDPDAAAVASVRAFAAGARRPVDLAPMLPDAELVELRQRFETIDDELDRTRARMAVAGELVVRGGDPAGLERIRDGDRRGDARVAILGDIAARVPDELVDRTVQVVMQLSGHELELPVAAIAPRMSEDQRWALLEKIAANDYDWAYANALKTLAPLIGPALVERALVLALSRRDDAWRGWALQGIIPRLDLLQLQRLRHGARLEGTKLEFQREAVAAALATRLAELGEPDKALRVAAAIVKTPASQAAAVSGLARHIGGGHLERLADRISAPGMRCDAFVALARHAPEPDRSRLLALAIEAAAGEPEPLARLTRSFPQRLGEVLALGETLDDYDRQRMLAALGPLGPNEWAAAAALARTITRDGPRSETFVALLAAALEPTRDIVHEVMWVVAGEDFSIRRRDQLRPVLDALMGLGPSVTQAEWSAVLPTLAARGRSALMSDLEAAARVVGMLGGAEALRQLSDAIGDVERWW